MKIIKESHLDHGLSPKQVEYIKSRFAEKTEHFSETFELPEELGSVMCALRGPLVGDKPLKESEVSYAPRGDRPYDSRLTDLPALPTRKVTVIAGKYGEEPCVLYTAFGGPLAPMEPGNLRMDEGLPEEMLKISEAFWARHALAKD